LHRLIADNNCVRQDNWSTGSTKGIDMILGAFS